MKSTIKLLALSLMVLSSLFFVACSDSSEGSNESDEAAVENKEDNASQLAARQEEGAMNQSKADEKSLADDNTPKTEITFDESSYDFGSITKGEKVNHTYTFTNTGSEPLIITNAKASCGCTVPEWPKEPIAPGEGGEIPVVFNGRSVGTQNKTITITANTNPPKTRITIRGKVEDAAES
jgi:hypothetical protein